VRIIAIAILVAAAASARPPFPPSPEPQGAVSMKGKNVLITGSTDGLGREVARRVAALGAHVIVHGRNAERGKAIVDEIARDAAGSAKFYPADFASLEEVRAFARTVQRDYDRLHVLVNNAGVLLRDRQVSRDGHELHFAVNYLAGFLLTRSLLPTLIASAPSRIVNVASGAQSPMSGRGAPARATARASWRRSCSRWISRRRSRTAASSSRRCIRRR
jgi:NAD(P)-dependent dehydrogenase (short-subunit alcohol dehydrogenase family)